jgi:predicted O-methyltransferase YrrM
MSEKNITVVGSSSYRVSGYIPTVEEIEKFVIDAGSDHVPTFGGKFEGGAQIQQVPDEIAPCIKAILDSGKLINDYLEIGVAAGGTTFLMNHFLHPANIVLIDDNQHPKHHVRQYILCDVSYKQIIGNSQSQTVIDLVKDQKFDIIIIDGDHSFNGVKSDVENYFPMLRKDGFLIFHDSVCQECWGVHLVVEEVKKSGEAELIGEYITEKHSRPCGVALFRKVL